ncbi:MAG: hypothetical protein M3R24_15055 [Chloroflexota bacterium]|nr:hypothetical protein [Chloroflexota bacterium]
MRRGATTTEVVVIGDGAHWLWELAALHFPEATQILDWFHATEYIWNAATAIWGETQPARKVWAEQQLQAVWDGHVAAVLAELQRHPGAGAAVGVAQTYFTNQQGRMNYPAYRARGLPIGSGTIERGCKQLVSARLKQAGMIWQAAGAIRDQPHHVMRHSSGLIVAEEPIVDLYGVGVCTDGALLLANKDDVELLQLLKFDILSWYGSAIFDQAEAQIHADVYPKPTLWGIGGTDPLTSDLLSCGDTRAIPYLHSPAVMQLMTALGTRTEAGIAIALGALRPGASTTRPRLLAALHGGTATLPDWHILTPDHQQVIERVLAGSHGAFLFDEDLLLVAHALGLSLPDAERLRKALKKGGEQATRLSNQLRAAALEAGWTDTEMALR